MKFRCDFPIDFCHLINDGFGCSDRNHFDDDDLQNQYCCDCLRDTLSEIYDFFHLCDEKSKVKN